MLDTIINDEYFAWNKALDSKIEKFLISIDESIINQLIEKRKLLNIKINQGKKELKETENLFESLMGKKAEHRYKFIQENANFTEQIDI